MNEIGESSAAARTANPYVIAVLAMLVYFGLPEQRKHLSVPTPQWFTHLAGAILEGHLWVSPENWQSPETKLDELIPTAEPGRFYVAYPPLPAFVAMPFVAIVGDMVTSAGMCRLLMVVAVLLFDIVARRASIRIHGEPMIPRDHYLIVAFFAFGTAVWEAAARGGDWHFAHSCAMCGLLLALVEFFGKRRVILVGLAVGLAMLARPTAMFAAVFFVVAMLRRREWKSIALLAAGPLVAIGLLCAYNAARFGTPFDFHYSAMLLRGRPAELMHEHGQFGLGFIPVNLFWFFLAPPSLGTSGFPWLAYDPNGMSLFLTSPAIIYAIVGAIRPDREKLARSALIGCVACLIPLLMYFNTGFWQFGHRFSLDYLPVLMIAIIVGIGAKPSKLARSLLIASIVIHVWGIAVCAMSHVARLPVPEWLHGSV
ncbi:MAG: hypothetical protein H6818_08520 [Phycisphaerales bacterium]|nr:hypothetical protein [Phycisphaerales bacterium]MCB9862614.1 hypothetical protein [Phycisphaerales bacterium]